MVSYDKLLKDIKNVEVTDEGVRGLALIEFNGNTMSERIKEIKKLAKKYSKVVVKTATKQGRAKMYVPKKECRVYHDC